jgi:hypothetical protein
MRTASLQVLRTRRNPKKFERSGSDDGKNQKAGSRAAAWQHGCESAGDSRCCTSGWPRRIMFCALANQPRHGEITGVRIQLCDGVNLGFNELKQPGQIRDCLEFGA